MNEEHDAENIQKPEKKLGGPGKPARRQMSAGDTKKGAGGAEKVEMHSVLPHPQAPTHVTAGRMTGCLPPPPLFQNRKPMTHI